MNFLNDLVSAIMPTLLSVIAAALSYVIARAAETAKLRWGIEIEATHRDALHSALMTGIRAALGRGLSGQDAVDAAISYARQSVPDALSWLDPTTDVLTSLAKSKLQDATLARPFGWIDLAK